MPVYRDLEGQRFAPVDEAAAPLTGGTPWVRASTPPVYGKDGLESVTLTVRDAESTARLLIEVMGFSRA